MTQSPSPADRSDLAARANAAAYDVRHTDESVEGSPHIRHESLRRLYASLATGVFDHARSVREIPEILDLGAGDGVVTRTFLELGARVTAVDASSAQLAHLAHRNRDHGDRLETEHGDARAVLAGLRERGRRYDVVTAVSFLHHIPDYLPLIEDAVELLEPHGQFFAFQDPMLRRSMKRFDHAFSRVAYVSWRLRRPDVVGGFRRHLRRRRGVWLDDCEADNVEYHELRDGVDPARDP